MELTIPIGRRRRIKKYISKTQSVSEAISTIKNKIRQGKNE